MNFWNTFAALFSNFGALTWQMVVMWGIGALLIYLAIVKKMEPSLLLPMGFGAILVNLPASGAITQGDTVGPISAIRFCCSSIWFIIDSIMGMTSRLSSNVI